MNFFKKTTEYLLYLFLFLLPWQARLIYKEGVINGGHWEWGSYSIYVIEFIFILLILSFLGTLVYSSSKPSWPVPKKMIILVVVFLLFCFLSIFWAQDQDLAFYWWLRIFEGAILFILILKIDFSIIKASWSLIFSGLIEFLAVTYQFLSQQVFSSKWLGIAFQHAYLAGTSVVETAEGRILRVYGSFSHPNIFAGFLIFLIFLLFTQYVFVKKSWQRMLILFISSLFTISLFLTYSRAAWISFLLNLIFLGIIIFKKASPGFRIPFFEFFGLVIIIILIFSGIFARDFIVRVGAQGRLENISIQQRFIDFQKSETIIKDNILLGNGLGNYTLALFKKYPMSSSWDYQPVANIYFLIISEIGLIGLILFLAMALFIFLRLGFNIYSPLFLSLLLIGMFDHWIFSLAFGIFLFWLSLGLVWRRCVKHELTGKEKIF